MPTVTNGRVLRSAVEANPHVQGLRATVDVELPPGQSADVRLFLKSGNRALTETWTFPFRAE